MLILRVAARQLKKDLTFIITLCKWKTNSKILQQKVNLTERESSESPEVKLLGVRWDTEQDEFQFDFKEVTTFVKSLPPTKRSIVRISAKVLTRWGCSARLSLEPRCCVRVGTKFWMETYYISGSI